MKLQFGEMNGAKLIAFDDVYGVECSIQADKIEGHEVCWLGPPIDLQGNKCFRMLLDKGRAQVIVEIMKQFIETGTIAEKPADLPKTIRSKEQSVSRDPQSPSDQPKA
jgi:hypothetical protein